MNLINEIERLQNSEVSGIVDKRLCEFEKLGTLGNDEWFSEMCFCLLTANSRASSAINIQNALGTSGFKKSSQENISSVIRMNKHRFPNNKAKFICLAREHLDVKAKIGEMDEFDAREWLVGNIKGLGYKEASHFLRNVGCKNLAILDRHILKLLFENGYLLEMPKNNYKKSYLRIEGIFRRLASRLGMSCAELDLYMWYMKTGKVLK